MSLEKPHRFVQLYNKLSRLPAGRWLFSRAVCFQAPYFGSIRPTVTRLEQGACEVRMKKRRRVKNHIGTVHAIAMANACELAAGLVTTVSIPHDRRWIPKGMTIQYLRKATTDLEAKATLEATFDSPEPQDVVIPVDVIDAQGVVVVSARITMYVSLTPR